MSNGYIDNQFLDEPDDAYDQERYEAEEAYEAAYQYEEALAIIAGVIPADAAAIERAKEYYGPVSEQEIREYAEKNCSYCRQAKESGDDGMPRHFASAYCQSGRRSHCTCDTCF